MCEIILSVSTLQVRQCRKIEVKKRVRRSTRCVQSSIYETFEAVFNTAHLLCIATEETETLRLNQVAKYVDCGPGSPHALV